MPIVPGPTPEPAAEAGLTRSSRGETPADDGFVAALVAALQLVPKGVPPRAVPGESPGAPAAVTVEASSGTVCAPAAPAVSVETVQLAGLAAGEMQGGEPLPPRMPETRTTTTPPVRLPPGASVEGGTPRPLRPAGEIPPAIPESIATVDRGAGQGAMPIAPAASPPVVPSEGERTSESTAVDGGAPRGHQVAALMQAAWAALVQQGASARAGADGERGRRPAGMSDAHADGPEVPADASAAPGHTAGNDTASSNAASREAALPPEVDVLEVAIARASGRQASPRERNEVAKATHPDAPAPVSDRGRVSAPATALPAPGTTAAAEPARDPLPLPSPRRFEVEPAPAEPAAGRAVSSRRPVEPQVGERERAPRAEPAAPTVDPHSTPGPVQPRGRTEAAAGPGPVHAPAPTDQAPTTSTGERVTLHLPGDDGGTRIQIAVRGDTVQARILTHDGAAGRALSEGVGELERALARQGFQQAQVRVDSAPSAPDGGWAPAAAREAANGGGARQQEDSTPGRRDGAREEEQPRSQPRQQEQRSQQRARREKER